MHLHCAKWTEFLTTEALDAFFAVDHGLAVNPLYPSQIHREERPSRQTVYPDEIEKTAEKVAQKPKLPEKNRPLKKKLEKKSIDNCTKEAYSDVNTAAPKLSAEEQQIVKALQSGERLVDDVIAETGLNAGKILAFMTMLELKGMVKRLPGKRISLK